MADRRDVAMCVHVMWRRMCVYEHSHVCERARTCE